MKSAGKARKPRTRTGLTFNPQTRTGRLSLNVLSHHTPGNELLLRVALNQVFQK